VLFAAKSYNMADMNKAAVNPFRAARFITSCAHLEQLPEPEVPEIAIAGRSNAGKSSALNALCDQKTLARVSKTPGRTQLLNFFEVPDLGRIVDLPGYGYAAVPGKTRKDWGELVTGYIESRQNLRGLVLVMDIRHPLMDYDLQLLGWAFKQNRLLHCLLTKSDKLAYGAARSTLLKVREKLGGRASADLFSAYEKTGIAETVERLQPWFGAPDA